MTAILSSSPAVDTDPDGGEVVLSSVGLTLRPDLLEQTEGIRQFFELNFVDFLKKEKAWKLTSTQGSIFHSMGVVTKRLDDLCAKVRVNEPHKYSLKRSDVMTTLKKVQELQTKVEDLRKFLIKFVHQFANHVPQAVPIATECNETILRIDKELPHISAKLKIESARCGVDDEFADLYSKIGRRSLDNQLNSHLPILKKKTQDSKLRERDLVKAKEKLEAAVKDTREWAGMFSSKFKEEEARPTLEEISRALAEMGIDDNCAPGAAAGAAHVASGGISAPTLDPDDKRNALVF